MCQCDRTVNETFGHRPSLGEEVEDLRRVIAQRFSIYDVRVTYDAVVFYISGETSDLEGRFDEIRRALVPRNYIPFLQKHGGELTIIVGKRKPIGRKGNIPNLVLLALTLISTTVTGAILWAGYFNKSSIFTFTNILNGIIFFVLPLMAILATHEMGHFIVARRYGVNASLPYFLPSIPPLGTLGAFISIRDPFPSRRALLEIGIAGPIAGFLVTIPVAVIGFVLTKMSPVPAPILPAGTEVFSVPFLYSVILSLFRFPSTDSIFPTAFAAWVGFFATALNLLPAGQLDGGHVVRALLGDNSKYLGWATILALIILSFGFESWLLIALFVLIVGFRHPPPLNDVTGLKLNRKMLGAVAAAMFLVTFTPYPVTAVPANTHYSVSAFPQSITIPSSTSEGHFNVTVSNLGNKAETINLTESPSDLIYFVSIFSTSSGNSSYDLVTVGIGQNVTVPVTVVPTSQAPPGHYELGMFAREGTQTETLVIQIAYMSS